MSRAGLFLVAAVTLALAGCGESHGTTDTGTSDTGRADTADRDTSCGTPDLTECFRGDCCDDRTSGSILDDCSVECPRGYSLTCDPAPGCGSGPRLCGAASDCTIINQDVCCGCGPYAVIHQDEVADYDRMRAECADLPCPPCAPPTFTPLVPTCDDTDRCVAVNVEETPYSECNSDDDCRVRTKDCCECGGRVEGEWLVAVSLRSGFEELVCPEGTACPECEPVYPGGVRARCDLREDVGTCVLTGSP